MQNELEDYPQSDLEEEKESNNNDKGKLSKDLDDWLNSIFEEWRQGNLNPDYNDFQPDLYLDSIIQSFFNQFIKLFICLKITLKYF